MVRKQEKFVALENFVDHDMYHDVVLAREGGALFGNELFEFKRLMEESHEVDTDYANFLLSILTVDEKFGPVKKQKEKSNHVIGNENDCYMEEENDPQYELFLENLKEHEKCYIFQFGRAGSPGVVRYEREISLDEESDSEPKRRLRSDIKQDYGLPSQMPRIENQHNHLTRSTSVETNKNFSPRKSKKEVKNQKVETEKHSTRYNHLMRSTSVETNKNFSPRKSKKEVKNQKVETEKHSTSEMVPDLDYLTFLQSSKVIDDYFVCTFGGGTVVFEKNDMENNQEKENSDDEHSSGVEVLDVAAFDKMNKDIFRNFSGQTMQSRFREELVTVLRKPYDKEEHKKLLQDITIRKPEDRHMDLRGGRERSCSTAKVGKSYMDWYPSLREQLLKFEDDGPKCLNLIRGFFFWLQKFLQEGSFKPWMDAKCLDISPEDRHPGFSPKRRRKI